MKQQTTSEHLPRLPEGKDIKTVSPDSNVEKSSVDEQAPQKL